MALKIRAILSAVGAAMLVAAGAQAQTAYTIGNDGTSLIRFDVSNPANAMVVGSFGGAASMLDAIDFRPLNGQMYGYSDSTDSFYTVNLNTAQLTLASTGAAAAPTNTRRVGLDFNPTIDRARLVTESDQNIVYNPNTGTVGAFTSVFYAAGDANVNVDPNIIDNAYTNSFAGATTTQQFVIDHNLNTLATLANNAGTLATIGLLGVDTGINTGFDIFSAGGMNSAYAILTPDGGTAGFYSINLATGAATSIGSLGVTDRVQSLAVIPAPGAVGVLAGGLLLAVRRRRA